MADNKILVEFQIVQKGTSISVVQKETDKLTKSQDKNTESQKKLSKQQEMGYGRQKQGIVQTANSTKNFSKLAQTIDGGGNSLVGAYATLAANVFATTALFNALKSAAKFDQLKEGLDNLGTSSGRTLSILAENLKSVTGEAISLEEAYRSAALGISGGFGATELEGLAKIAKGAAQTLGRDLGDAFDRLTRGAIKLEPEILDELGIMVRLDDAVENYATKLGKTAGALSQAERRQAFMNAILEQGTAKFGEISDEVETNVFDKLAATFGDLTKNIFSFINAGLGPVLGLLANNATLLAGAMLAFGTTIAGQILPGLTNAGQRAQSYAEKMQGLADITQEQADIAKTALQDQFKTFDTGNKSIKKYRASIVEGTAELSDLEEMEKKVTNAIRGHTSANTAGRKVDAVALAQREKEKVLLTELIALETAKGRAAVAASSAAVTAKAAENVANVITAFSAGAQSFVSSFGAISGASKILKGELIDIAKNALPKGQKELGFFAKRMIGGKVAAFQFSNSLRLIGAAALGALPIIAGLTIAIGGAIAIYNALYNTEQQKAFIKGQKQLNEMLSKLPEKAAEYKTTFDSTLPIADVQIKQFDIISNSVSEINDKLKQQIKLREEANKSRPRGAQQNLGLPTKKALKEAEKVFKTFEDIQYSYGLTAGGFGTQKNIITRAALEQEGLNKILGEGVLSFQEIQKEVGQVTGPQNFKKQQQSLASLFKIKDSDAFKSFKAILTSDIPRQADILKNELNLEEVIAKGGEITEDILVKAIDRADQKTRLLNDNFRGVNQTLQESEKATSAFIKALAPKTSVDAISLQFQALERELGAASESAQKAGLDPITQIGRALADTGQNVARVVGIDFFNQLKKVNDLQKLINDKKLAGEEVDETTQKLLEAETNELGKHEKSYQKALKLILDIQKAEITRKETLATLSKLTKETAGYNVAGKSAENIQLDIQTKEFAIRKAQLADQRKILENTFTGLRVGKQSLTIEQFKKKTLDEQLQIAKDNGIELNNVFALQNQALQENNLELEKRLALADEANQKEIITQQALLKQLELQKQLTDLTNTQALSQAKLDKFARTGTTDLNSRETYELQVSSAREALTQAEKEADIKKKIIDAELAVQKARLYILAEEANAKGIQIDVLNIENALEKSAELNKDLVDKTLENTRTNLALTVVQGISEGIELAASGNVFDGFRQALAAATSEEGAGGSAITFIEGIKLGEGIIGSFTEQLMSLGPDGEAINAMAMGALKIAESISIIGSETATTSEKLKAGMEMFAAIGQAQQAQAKAQVSAIDQAIEAEKRRDGKSKESVAKIAAMEKKKEAIQRKAFEQNKKIQLAQAVINGMSAIQSGFATQPFFPVGLAMGALAIAMTAAQIQAIRKQQFQGGASETPTASNTALNIGKRSNAVDVSRGATSGELNYLRGGRTTGSNLGGAGASFPGGAMGRRGYADGGIVVGERGPEVITPTRQIDVTPNYALGGGSSNVNFTINAVDAAGVEDVLMNQRGNIIRMIREAANENGTMFLEEIDTQAYGSSR